MKILSLQKRREAFIFILLIFIYFISAKLGLKLAFVNESATAVWPPTGIAIASLLLFGYRVWPAIFLGAFLANLSTNGDIVVSLGIALGNTLEAITAVYLINKLARGKESFFRVGDFLKFIVLAVPISTMVSATIGIFTLILGGFASWSEFGAVWLTWWMGDISGAIIITPFLILWSNKRPLGWRKQKYVEAFILLLMILITGFFIFGKYSSEYPLEFLCLPIIIWIAFRLGMRATITGIVILSAIAITGTLHGYGPFIRSSQNESLLLLQAFMDVMTVSSLALAIAVIERKRSDERFQRVLDNMLEGFQIIGYDWTYLYVNDAVIRQGQKSREQLLGHTMMEAYPGIEKTEVFEHLKQCMEKRIPYKMENEFLLPDGNKGWFELRIEPISEGIFILSTDITKKKFQEEKLHIFASIIKSTNDAIVGKNLEGKITSWNPAAEKLYGYKKEEVIGKLITIIFPKDRKDEFENIMDKMRKGQRVEHFETKRVTKDGTMLDVSVTISPMINEKGELVGASAITRDITEQKRLQEVQSRLASIVEFSNEAIIGKSLDGTITSWNKGAQELYGYTKEEIIGKSNKLLIPQGKESEWDEFSKKLLKGEAVRDFETIRKHKNGRNIDVSITFSPVKDRNGTITGTSAIVRDISERKIIDEMKNEFISLASHQLKTPLTTIGWYTELLQEDTSNFPEKHKKYLQEVYKANQRMISLVNSLLNVSRIEMGTFMINPITASIKEYVDGVVKEFDVQVAAKELTLHKAYEENLPQIPLDPMIVKLVVSNLLSNAIKYSYDKGSITIGITTDDKNISIQVSDQGIGIPKAQQDKIYGKFFRADNAKSMNTDGSGLGLYIVKSIIYNAGGTMTFETEENKGTTFTVSFPLSGMRKKEGTRHLH